MNNIATTTGLWWRFLIGISFKLQYSSDVLFVHAQKSAMSEYHEISIFYRIIRNSLKPYE